MLGRPTVNMLGRMGSQVVVPFRSDEMDTRHLKVIDTKHTRPLSFLHCVQHG